jgi:hypothetical protein
MSTQASALSIVHDFTVSDGNAELENDVLDRPGQAGDGLPDAVVRRLRADEVPLALSTGIKRDSLTNTMQKDRDKDFDAPAVEEDHGDLRAKVDEQRMVGEGDPRAGA